MSERLTKRDENGNAYYDWGCLNRNHWVLGRHVDRLAAYEDSQMTPEEVQSLAQAKADGRLVVLPCKVGTVVYAHSSVAGYDSIISGIVQYFVVHEQFIDLFVLFKPNPNEDKHDFAEYIRADKIGKTVFLTREEAEKAFYVDLKRG